MGRVVEPGRAARGLALDDPLRFAGAARLYGTLPFDAGVPVELGRLSGVRVLLAQGDADTVIPRELQDRTWEYATEESGADVVAPHDPGGHGITAGALDALARWTAAPLA